MPFSLFMLLGWNSISKALLMIWSIHLGLVEKILVFWSWM